MTNGNGPDSIYIEGIGTLRHQSCKKGRHARNYYLRKNHMGKRITISLKTDDFEEAKKRAKKESNRIIEKYGRGEPIGADANKIKFEDMADLIKADYTLKGNKSSDRLEDSIHHLAGFFAGFKAINITGGRITAYADWRHKEEGAALGTVQNELAALKRMFTLAHQAGNIFQRPAFPTISLSNARTGFFEEEEFEAVHEHLPEEIQPIARFGYFTGWRLREVINLEWKKNVDLIAGIVRLEVGSTKNGEGRTFPVGTFPALKDLLEKQREYTNEVEKMKGIEVPWVFHRDGLRIASFKGAWKRATKEAGVSRIFHDLRRTAVRNLERAGVPRSVAMKLTGHKTEAVYRRYAIVSEADLAEGVGKLAALHGKQPEPSPVGKKVAVGGGGVVLSFPGRR
jgi:integrase